MLIGRLSGDLSRPNQHLNHPAMVVQRKTEELRLSRLLQKTTYIIGWDNRLNLPESVLTFLLQHLTQHFGEMEILLVGYGGGGIETVEILESVRYLHLKAGENHSAALNRAAQEAKGDILVFADPFIGLAETDYKRLLFLSETFEAVSPNKDRLQAINKEGKLERVQGTMVPTNFAAHLLLITRSAFERIGGWDENIQDAFASTVALAHLIGQTTRNYTLAVPAVQLMAWSLPAPSLTDQSYLAEIGTFSGLALARYSQRLRQQSKAPPAANLRFVLAVTTYNRKDYLAQFIESWLSTRNQEVEWRLIIADDGSSDGTLEYIRTLQVPGINLTLIENKRSDVLHQTNTILQQLSELEFDVCFKCDDDVRFIKKGWDDLYWATIQRTGYDHLVYYNKKWRPALTYSTPKQYGQLIAHCDLSHIQGAFFTITPEVLKMVGYFDAYHLGFRGYEHNDYTARCCRAGFNVLENPFDVKGSNDFIVLQEKLNYVRAMSLAMENAIQSEATLTVKKQLVYQNRVYVPFNQVEASLDALQQEAKHNEAVMNNHNMRFQFAEETWVWNRGLVGVLGSILKRGYNFCLRRRWFFFPSLIKRTGRTLLQLGDDFVNIDT